MRAPLAGRTIAAAFLALSVVALSGCGSSTIETSVEATAPADRALGASVREELAIYEEGFDLEVLPDAQQAQLAGIVNNLPQAAGGVRVLRVEDGVVEAETGFPDDEEGVATGRLICGAIERAVSPGDPGGHRVLGEGGAVLARCRQADANYP